MTAALRFARLLRLIPRFADDRPHRLVDVAAALGVPVEQVRDDLQSLAERVEDTSGQFVEGVTVLLERETVQLRSRWFGRPLGLAPDETAAVALGLALLGQEGPAEELGVFERAREKINALAAAGPRDGSTRGRGVRSVPRAARLVADRESRFLATLQRAWVARRPVTLRYRKPGASSADERTVRPWRLVSACGGWFLAAEDVTRQALRVFRLDRIERVRMARGRYEIPVDFTVESLLRDGRVFAGGAAGTLVIRYGPAIARWIAEREPCRPLPDGSVDVTYPLADDDWAVRHVLRYGPDAIVVGPDRVRQRVRTALARMG